MYSYENYVELYVYILYQIRNITKRIVRDITNWLLNTEDSIRFNSKVTTELLKSNLINHTDFDRILSKGLDQNSHNAVELSKSLITDICI